MVRVGVRRDPLGLVRIFHMFFGRPDFAGRAARSSDKGSDVKPAQSTHTKRFRCGPWNWITFRTASVRPEQPETSSLVSPASSTTNTSKAASDNRTLFEKSNASNQRASAMRHADASVSRRQLPTLKCLTAGQLSYSALMARSVNLKQNDTSTSSSDGQALHSSAKARSPIVLQREMSRTCKHWPRGCLNSGSKRRITQTGVRELGHTPTMQLFQMLGSSTKTGEGPIGQSRTFSQPDLAQLAEPACLQR